MGKMGVSEKMIRVVKSTLLNTTAVLHVEGEQREIDIREGTGQGTTLGPILCNLFLLPILLQWDKQWQKHATTLHTSDGKTAHSLLHSFADDTAVIVKDRNTATLIVTTIHAYLQDFLVNIHVATTDSEESKSVVIFVPANKQKKEEMNCASIMLADGKGSRINFVPKATYLGHVIHQDLTDDHHLRTRMGKASQVFGALRQNLFGNKNVWRKIKVRVLLTMILPTMLDGAENSIISPIIMREMETLYHRLVRSCLHITPYTQRKYKVTSEMLLRRLNVQLLHHY